MTTPDRNDAAALDRHVLDNGLSTALELARHAVRMIRDGSDVGFATKDDGSELTAVDTAINDMVIDMITHRHPGHRILGEEGGAGPAEAEYVWVCDPIDGTLPFTVGLGLSVFSLALCQSGTPIVAVVAEGSSGTVWQAVRGQGARRGAALLSVSGRTELTGARVDLSVVQPGKLAVIAQALEAHQMRLIRPMAAVRTAAAVAEGRLDAVLYDAGHPWDLAAASLLVTEAGGRAERIDRSAWPLDRDGVGTWLLATPGVWEGLADVALRHDL